MRLLIDCLTVKLSGLEETEISAHACKMQALFKSLIGACRLKEQRAADAEAINSRLHLRYLKAEKRVSLSIC